MPTTRLTIDLPESEIDFLKKYAKKNKTSVSELIDRWVKSLKTKSKTIIHPEVKKFSGIIPDDIDIDKAISDYIEKF